MIKKIKQWIKARQYYVIADANDNSITFSRALYKAIEPDISDKAKVLTSFIPQTQCFAFVINPDINEEETQLADIQCCSKTGDVGYECLVPTVNHIFYKYGLGITQKVKLPVKVKTMGNGVKCYEIQKK